jgi:hypothetical protein
MRRATCEQLLHFSRPEVSRIEIDRVGVENAGRAARRWGGLLAVTVAALWSSPTHAQERVEFIPSVSVFSIYDGNLFATNQGSVGKIFQVRPSFEGNFESPRYRLLGLYSFDAQRSNHSSLNTLDARRHALGEARVRTDPMTSWGLAMRYDRSETPGDINIETGILGERRQAERWQLTPTFARRMGTHATMSAGYDWSSEYLVDGERGTPARRACRHGTRSDFANERDGVLRGPLLRRRPERARLERRPLRVEP